MKNFRKYVCRIFRIYKNRYVLMYKNYENGEENLKVEQIWDGNNNYAKTEYQTTFNFITGFLIMHKKWTKLPENFCQRKCHDDMSRYYKKTDI